MENTLEEKIVESLLSDRTILIKRMDSIMADGFVYSTECVSEEIARLDKTLIEALKNLKGKK